MQSIVDMPVSFLCVRCQTIKRELWGRNSGIVVSRNYVYSLGYTETLRGIRDGYDSNAYTSRQSFRMEYERRFLGS